MTRSGHESVPWEDGPGASTKTAPTSTWLDTNVGKVFRRPNSSFKGRAPCPPHRTGLTHLDCCLPTDITPFSYWRASPASNAQEHPISAPAQQTGHMCQRQDHHAV